MIGSLLDFSDCPIRIFNSSVFLLYFKEIPRFISFALILGKSYFLDLKLRVFPSPYKTVSNPE